MGKETFARKRSEHNKRELIEIYTELHDVLSKAKTLNGDERDALIAGAIEKLERRVQKEQQFKDKSNSLKGNREKIPAAGGTLAENDFVILKMACPEERDCYLEVSYE